jgi:hypothetical protein
MKKDYSSVVVHYSANSLHSTPNCRYVTSFSYTEGNQDVAWFNNKQYVELFGKKRSRDNANKLLAIVRLAYKNRVIRRRYKCDQSLCLSDKQVGLTSESVRTLFDDMNASEKDATVSKGNIWDAFMYYWEHPFHATRISFKVGILSFVIGAFSMILSAISLLEFFK